MLNRCLAAIALTVLLAGCALGQRPSLDKLDQPSVTTVAAGTPTGTAGADQVLAALEKQAPQATFTAKYHLLRRLGQVERDAVVVHRPGATAVTIGDWSFIQDGQDRTCQISAGTCVAGLLLQRVSDVVNTNAFWASSPAIEIRLSLEQRTAPPTFSTQTVAGQASNCISIALTGGAEKYCVAPNGIASLVDRNDQMVTLTALSGTVDERAFRQA